MKNLQPRIYIACLAAYNNGILHGEWINADQSTDTLHEEVKTVLASSPIPNAEEWAIHDNEGFGDIFIQEYTNLETISELAAFLAERGELGAVAYSYAHNLDDATRMIEEQYHGEFTSEEDFVYYWIHEVDCLEIPEYLQCYIDYKAMARDYFINDFHSIEVDGKIHVFSYY
jgi:antirestriction protein